MSEMIKKSNLRGSSSPHDAAKHSVSSVMLEVSFALTPILIFATIYFGWRALALTVISVAAAVLSEFIYEKLMHKKVTITDGSAIVTGLLLAYNVPASAPLWMPAIGSAFAIIIVKQIFGGIGKNFANPAIAGRCFLLVSFASAMASFKVDGVTVATPLANLAAGNMTEVPSYMSCFLGVIPGSLGETSKVLILAGGIYLMIRKIIDFRIPLAFIGTVFILSYLFGGDGLYEILTGGLFLGAFFMATDYVTSPMNKAGKWIAGILCGLITTLVRFYGGYPEGVSFSILLMNVCTPLIDKFTVPRAFGEPKKSLFKSKKGGASK